VLQECHEPADCLLIMMPTQVRSQQLTKNTSYCEFYRQAALNDIQWTCICSVQLHSDVSPAACHQQQHMHKVTLLVLIYSNKSQHVQHPSGAINPW
jgi:hypothetical protein